MKALAAVAEAADCSVVIAAVVVADESWMPLEMVDLEAEAAKEAKRKATPLFALLDCGEGMCGV